MKKIVLLSVAVLLSAGIVFAQNNNASTEQNGNANTAIQEQQGDHNDATIKQGHISEGMWEQNGGYADQYQEGSSNEATIKQRSGSWGSGNWSVQKQYGTENNAQVVSWNANNTSWQYQEGIENLAKINSVSTLAVVPSRDEPFGLVALEAMACGTPVIASKTGGLVDFVNNEVGRLFPEGDVQSLAQSIISSIKENDKEKKGEFAKKYAHQNFSWNNVADELENLYKEITGEED